MNKRLHCNCFLLQLAKTQIFIGGVTTKNLNNDTKFQASFYNLVPAAATTVMQRTITFNMTKLVENSVKTALSCSG